LVAGVGITTVGWLAVTFLTPPADKETLQSFYEKIRPMGRGWRKVVRVDAVQGEGGEGENLAAGLLAWFLGCLTVYSALFGTGYFLYGERLLAMACFAVLAVAIMGLFRTLPRVGFTR
jgi:hypothetical protein